MRGITLLLLAFAWQPLSHKAPQPLKPRPNIILFVADDHGKDALGCYGNPVIQTPHLDALAEDAWRFDRAFCTTASCSASRSVILSGKHNHANGQYGHEHSYHHFRSFAELLSLPVALEKSGYRTAHIGKYHVGPESVYHFQQRYKANARSPIEMAAECESFIKAKSEKPFFLYFCFADPHRSGEWAEELPHHPNRFGNKAPGESAYPGVREVSYSPDEVLVPPFLPDNAETRAEIAQYYQSISRLDQGVGQLIQYLKASAQYDNTLIIYISDNGMAFPGAKTTLYEAGMQLPFLLKMPGQTEARTTDVFASWTDLMPTLLDAAEALPVEPDFHGHSLLPLLERSQDDNRKAVFASHTFHEITMYYPMRVVRGERYKLIMNLASGLEYPFASDLFESSTWQGVLKHQLTTLGQKPIAQFLHRPRFELYDLQEDPWETRNLASLPAYQSLLDSLQQEIRSFQEGTNDPWGYKWKYE